MKRSGPLRRKARPTAVFRCETCGSLFERRTDSKPRNAKGLVLCRSCSRRQATTGRTYPQRHTGRALTCTQCGAEFYRSAARISSRPFCSRPCVSAWQKENEPPAGLVGSANNAGPRNGRYRHGRRVGGHIPKRAVRNQVIERDGDWCLLCGRPPKGLHLHRVRYGSEGGKYEVGNCVQLCGEHHALVHSNKRLWKPRLLTHISTPGSSEFAALRRSRTDTGAIPGWFPAFAVALVAALSAALLALGGGW